MFSIRPNPEFSWSFSRDSSLETCPRKYYYSYYASHNGWFDQWNSTPEQRKFYQFKNVTNLALCFGADVHNAIKEQLRGILNLTNGTDFQDRIQQKLHNDCVKGKELEAWKATPKTNPALMEILYWGGFQSEKSIKSIQSNREKLSMVGNFFRTKTMKEYSMNEVVNVIEVDEDLNSEDHGRCTWNDIILFAKVDYLYKRADGKIIVVDWKTNKKDIDIFEDKKNSRQLYLYAYYVHQKYGVPYDNMICRFENVITGNTSENSSIQPSDIDELLSYVSESIGKMKKFVKNGDLKENEPLEELCFPQKKGRYNFNCNGCPFQGVCRSDEELEEMKILEKDAEEAQVVNNSKQNKN